MTYMSCTVIMTAVSFWSSMVKGGVSNARHQQRVLVMLHAGMWLWLLHSKQFFLSAALLHCTGFYHCAAADDKFAAEDCHEDGHDKNLTTSPFGQFFEVLIAEVKQALPWSLPAHRKRCECHPLQLAQAPVWTLSGAGCCSDVK